MGAGTKTTSWKIRPGFAFSAGAGIGAGVYVFDFLNESDNTVYGMLFAGLGLAGGFGSGASGAIGEITKKLVVQLAGKAIGGGMTAITDSNGYKDRVWTRLPCDNSFSANALHNSLGRVTILGASALHVGAYRCYVTAWEEAIITTIDLFHSASVEVLPQNFDIQIGVICGLWRKVFEVTWAGQP